MILPAARSFYLLGVNALAALFATLLPAASGLWYACLGGSLLVWVLDGLLALRRPRLVLARETPNTLSLGVQQPIYLCAHNTGRRVLQVQLYDHYPVGLEAQDLPLRFSLQPAEHSRAGYRIRALQRGCLTFTQIQARILSPLQLWWRNLAAPVQHEVRVYPNFAAVAQYALLATDNHLSHLGIMKRRRRGEGLDFHQLREYRPGDSLRQIDWKATARMYKPIAKDYQDERDQEVIFLLDCSHRMQAKDDELSHFDHTLNAALLLAHVALKQGDAVGLGTFGGVQRWLKPHKGQPALNYILNTLYDLQATHYAPDYHQVATELLVRQKKRALVIFLSNLRDEDMGDLLPALQLLRQRHLVLFASLREQILDQPLKATIDNLEDALNYAATQHYLSVRQHTLGKLRTQGAIALDVQPEALSVALINTYLEVKRSGRL